ncbi:DNA-3-methyladenine glycosylase family protein [Leptothoe kymatousa]|uniref:DNA-3-methyladenine glycosylase II n=1 Tax=Leptothoe kymatousa TAU-MAC 1615 TaxID=2364775 RepID=A0ABS5Y0T4_9CYAN|nr:hypothetical protein [Leptothoe kymatousa]MBT9311423.1 DNA-3-methyladenine glycosylase 2 family protein [Leptothoe kymatousa TAU-MAC 1615]
MKAQTVHSQCVAIARQINDNLARAIVAAGPLPLAPRQDVPFPVRLCRAVAGQQLSVKAAQSIWARVLAQAAGQPLMDYFTAASPETLRSCGLSKAKAKAMGEIALAHRTHQIDAATLGNLDHKQRTQQLTKIWGVGPWTADMVGIFYFGDPDIWPDGDATACKCLATLTNNQTTISTAAHFAPYRSYLALYMWHQADAPII